MEKLEKKLNCDLLFDVAEGLISKSNGIYFDARKQAKILKFMMVNRDCMSAFLSFFSKAKEVDICVRYVTEIDFYKAKSIEPSLNWNEEEKLEYQGPYRGFADFSDNRELCLDSLEVSEMSGCSARLPYYVALNAAEVKFNANMDRFHCFSERGCAKVNATNTQILEMIFFTRGCIEIETPGFPTAEWIELISFIHSSCPNLKKLRVRVDLNENSLCVSSLLDTIHKVIIAMNVDVLPKVGNLNKECSIEFELQCFVEKADLEKMREGEQSQHELLKMGISDQKAVNELEIARVIRISEKVFIRFSIYGSEDEENSDGYRDIIDDAFDDYDNYGEYDGEEDEEDFDDYDDNYE